MQSQYGQPTTFQYQPNPHQHGQGQPTYGGIPPANYTCHVQGSPMHQPSAAHNQEQNDDRYPKNDTAFLFSEQSIRRAFIRKVYSILTVQLLVTMAVIAFFIYTPAAQDFVRKNSWVVIVAWVAAFGFMIAIACVDSARRTSPLNFILLGIFTLLEGFLLGCMSIRYNASQIFLAAGITAGVALALTLFSFQTKWDFTKMTGCLFVCTIILFIFGILMIFFYSKVLYLVYACLGALLFSMWLVVDTQMMMGGKHQYSLSPEEYIFAALNLYIDIINMFMFILSILGLAGGD